MAGFFINWIRNYWLEGSIIFFGLLHQVVEKVFRFPLPWFDNYGDDLLAVPFVSSCVLLMENYLVYHDHKRKHSFLQLLLIFILISVLFEFFIPTYNKGYTKDLVDILFYLIGFIGYYSIKKILSDKSERI